MSEDKFWNDVSERVRKAKGLHPLTPQEAEKAYAEAPESRLSQDEIEAIVSGVAAGKKERNRPVESDEWLGVESEEVAEVAEDVLVLNRKPGESDPETEELLEELRRKALSEDDGEEDEEDA